MQTMYYIGLDVHKRTISYCVKDGSGTIHGEGTIAATRFDLDSQRVRAILTVHLA
jgi:transposase